MKRTKQDDDGLSRLLTYILSDLDADQRVELHHTGVLTLPTLDGDYVLEELQGGLFRLTCPTSGESCIREGN